MKYLLTLVLITVACIAVSQEKTGDYPYLPVKFSDVRITDNFWAPKIETNREVTIPFAFSKCETTGRLKNFKVAGSVNRGEIKTGKFCSLYGYDDSDVYKIIEGAAYSLTNYPDPVLESFLDSLITDIAAAQEPDGYLYSMRTINPDKSWAKNRWDNDRYNGSHELYDAGHMYEAAVAYFYATGKRSLLDVAIKNANLMCETFGPGKRKIASGHQEIEIGLAKLYRVTGDTSYLVLAKFFLDERGKGEKAGSTYTQDHKPVIDQDEAVGHAVRATYMYSAMADIAALMGDTAYLQAIDKIWNNVVSSKIYVTGGIGARANGEAYGDNYELPNLTAYNETCAAIANIFWNYRMFLLHGDSKYIDVLERTLYNGMISGVSLDGTTFFYPNPLASNGDYARSEWFDCSCCPSNVTRFISSVSGYIYATRSDTLFVNLYAGSDGHVKLKGTDMHIIQETQYPWDGKITIEVGPDKPFYCAICLRIPGWAGNIALPGDLYRFSDLVEEAVNISVNGKLIPVRKTRGYAVIAREWKQGDVIELILPMAIREVTANPVVTDDRDRIALERGPIVFCAEGIDNNDDVSDIIIPPDSRFTYSYDSSLLKGVGCIEGDVLKLTGDGFTEPVRQVKSPFRAIPYYAWCNRGAGKMNVWFYGTGFVFPPLMSPSASLFLDTITVRMKRYEGQEISYTVGGANPSPSSKIYAGPLVLHSTSDINAAAYNRNGRESEEITGKFIKTGLLPATSVTNIQPGLRYSYYEGRFRKVPDFTKEKALKTGIIEEINIISPRDTADAYGLMFEGYISVPADGVYTFYLISDDGSRLVIAGHVTALSDGLHEMEEASGQEALQAGLHPFRLEYFDYGSDEGLSLFVSVNGQERVPVDRNWFYHN